MDIRRHLKRGLTNADLERMGGAYKGVIVEVVEEPMRNRFKARREVNPVIVFGDGWRLVPNIGTRRALVDGYGPETDDWSGRRVRIFLRPMTRKNSESAQRYEKAVECLETPASEPGTTASESTLTAADISWS